MIIKERLKLLDSMQLQRGAHADGNGKCALEAVAWLAGEWHSDHPVCVSPVLGDFCRSWNDSLDSVNRQRLKPYLIKLIGTDGDETKDLRRSWMAFDWLARVYTPAFMELTSSLRKHAAVLRALPEIVDKGSLERSAAALAAAGDAALAATRAAALAAPQDAAWDAAWDATRFAAREAAGDAAWGAALDAAGDVAWTIARATAGDAARAAAWDAASAAAGDAAWVADILAPVVTSMRESAFDLLDRMINV